MGEHNPLTNVNQYCPLPSPVSLSLYSLLTLTLPGMQFGPAAYPVLRSSRALGMRRTLRVTNRRGPGCA